MIRNSASFRDPAATVYLDGSTVVREIRPEYFRVYDDFMDRIYPELVDSELIISHKELSNTPDRITIAPEIVPFISYPYEWTFKMIREAALVTLRINQVAMEHGLMLKDASAYNIQWYQGRMRLIDTTSFMPYTGNTPWPSYSQFVRHFLCPLLWIKYYNPILGRLSEIYLDGIPISLTSRMLPFLSRLDVNIVEHIYLQSWDLKIEPSRPVGMSKLNLKVFLDELYKFIKGLKYSPVLDRGWLKYAEAGSYSINSYNSKQEIVSRCLVIITGRTVLDLGANTGVFSRMADTMGGNVVAVDADHDCMLALAGDPRILPLVVDLCNPSPGIGWGNTERRAFWDRVGVVDTIMALALIHHLSIRNNIPLGLVAELLAAHCNNLIIEWIPIEDRQARRLLGAKNIPEYSLPLFLDEFGRRFNKIQAFPIAGSGRTIYLMEKN